MRKVIENENIAYIDVLNRSREKQILISLEIVADGIQ